MALTFNAKTYTADSYQQNAVGYYGAAKTVTTKDDVRLARQAPKATSTYSGTGRTEFKLSRTLTLTGALTPVGEAIVTVSINVPVGAASADVDALMNDSGAFVSSASAKTLAKSQIISY